VDDESGALRRSDAELHTNLVHLVWALFLAVREKENLSDLVPGFFLLIACLHAVLSGRSQEFQKALVFPEPRDGCKNTPSAPAGAAAGDAGDGPAHTKAAGGGADSTSMLAQLCRAYCGKEPFLLAQAQDALGKVHAMLDELLPKTAPQGYKKDVDGRGVGEDAMLHVSLSALTSLVVSGRPSRSVSGDNVEVDGLIFLQHPELVGSASEKAQKRVAPSLPSSPSKFPRSPPRTASTRVPCSPMRGQQAAGAPKTPERGHAMYQRGMSTMQAVTPMQGVMKDVRWLSIYVQAESARPDDILRTFLAACDTDQTASVVARLDNLPQKVVEDVEEDLIAMAVKLYLKSLRFILQREEERLKRNNFTNILQDDSMHRAFLAICFEMVFHIHMRHHLSFPQIPIAFGVCALEFYIMTDNFLTYFQDILPTEVRRHLARKRENILDQHMWKKESTLVAHLRERDLAAHLSRALETCHKGAALPAQASPMIVRSCLPPARPVAAASEGLGAFLREAGLSGGCGGLAAALAMQQPVPKTEAPAERAVKAEKSAAEVRAEGRAEDRGPQAKQQAARGVPDKPDTPERKDVQMSAATTPFVDKANKNLHILKQLTSVARGLWRRVSSVTTALCRALQVSESSLNRALNVANRILCSAKARELLHDRHLHQVLMCVVFAACRVEDPDKVLFRKIINHHHNLFAHLQLDEKIYWVLDIGPAANQTGLCVVCMVCVVCVLCAVCVWCVQSPALRSCARVRGTTACSERCSVALLAARGVTQMRCAGNLIEFYNKKFIPLCKEFVLEDTCMPASAPSARTHASGTGAGAIGAARLPPRLLRAPPALCSHSLPTTLLPARRSQMGCSRAATAPGAASAMRGRVLARKARVV